MSNDHFDEHPLDSLLNSESEEEFGEPEIRDRYEHGADPNVDGKLKDWSAQDFASIYVRFRPHLERHARRYISNPVQAEEIVQDAFLYLMTTLPELDSELGVLKFLKWKIRLLCFDVLRSSSRLKETAVPEHAEYASDDSELSADLERAEDNAVIRLALSSLNPRQREVLVASVYEEKSNDEIAKQLELSPNATRQLLFRARSAFKQALIGEAEVQGKSVSQILSLAAKKAAFDSKQNITKVGALVLLLAVGLGIGPALLPSATDVDMADPSNQFPIEGNLSKELSNTASDTDTLSAPEIQLDDDNSIDTEGEISQELFPATTGDSSVIAEAQRESEPTVSAPVNSQSFAPESLQQATTSSVQTLSEQSMTSILSTNVSQAGFYTNSYAQQFKDVFSGVSVEVFGGTGISAFLDLEPELKTVSNILFQMWIEGERYLAAAKIHSSESMTTRVGLQITVTSQEFYVVDEQGNVNSESPLANAMAKVVLNLDANGSPESASLLITPLD